MKDYLQKILHMEIKVKAEDSLYKDLPLFFKGAYKIFIVDSGGVKWIALQPRKDVRLSQLRQNRAFLESKKQLNVALVLEKRSLYAKETMIEEGIPFIIMDDTVYLPFLGVLLREQQRMLKPVHQIAFLTQKILLTGIYKGYNKASVTELSELFKVSKMAVSRCFDEIEYMVPDMVKTEGRRRYLEMGEDKKGDWEKIRPYLRNPVIKIFNLKRDIRLNVKAGMSALSEYSMLSDNGYPTYAVEKKDLKKYGIIEQEQALDIDDPGCIVFEVGYLIDNIMKNEQDPLSVILSIDNYEKDERIEIAMEEMLEKYVW